MPEFLTLQPLNEALTHFIDNLPDRSCLEVETVPTFDGLGRILAEDVLAPHPLPEFSRSTVDGYAVRAEDTYGATSSLPAYLKLSGEIRMGLKAEGEVQSAEAMLIHTGAMLPPGADAVVMLEDTQLISEQEVEILRPVAVGENVIEVGEDVKQDERVIQAGTKLRSQEIGGLLALGYTEASVFRRPRVGIISTGDEVVPPDETPKLAQVRDINSYSLQSVVHRHGGDAILYGIVPDSLESLEAVVSKSHAEDDMLVVTAGSSVSARDLTAQAFTALGEPGILVHGIAIKPGKPTILAIADTTPAIGLPGNPVSALVVGSLILPSILNRLYGLPESISQPTLQAKLTANLPSQAGRDDYHPVRVWRDESEVLAEPVHGRSNLIFSLVRANGLVLIPANSTGHPAGAIVDVLPF